jgi:hypothetical protein
MRWIIMLAMVFTVAAACNKNDDKPLRYFEVGLKTTPDDWRDSAYVVATSNAQLLTLVEAELNKPLHQRKIIAGDLAAGSAGYNKNAGHPFNWHLKENKWELTDLTIEIIDGRPYSDVEVNINYWLDTVKRFGPWGSYIKREITNIK